MKKSQIEPTTMEKLTMNEASGDNPSNNVTNCCIKAFASNSSDGDHLSIADALVQNILLRKELCEKLDQIIQLKSKLTDLRERSHRDNESFDFDDSILERTQYDEFRHANNLSLVPSNEISAMLNDTMNRTFSLSESNLHIQLCTSNEFKIFINTPNHKS